MSHYQEAKATFLSGLAMGQACIKHFLYNVSEATQQPYEVVPIIFFQCCKYRG